MVCDLTVYKYADQRADYMDHQVNILYGLKRSNVPTVGKLGNISKEKLTRILEQATCDTSTDVKDKCWLWGGTKMSNKNGHQHAYIWFMQKYVMVHRLMFHNFVQDVPLYERKSGALQVYHTCNQQNGQCINPWHMYLGTTEQNAQTLMEEGNITKAPPGELNYNAHTSNEQVVQARRLYAEGKSTQAKIAKIVGVAQSQISRWVSGTTRSIEY